MAFLCYSLISHGPSEVDDTWWPLGPRCSAFVAGIWEWGLASRLWSIPSMTAASCGLHHSFNACFSFHLNIWKHIQFITKQIEKWSGRKTVLQLSVPAYDADLTALSLSENTAEHGWGFVTGSGFGPGHIPGILKNSSWLLAHRALFCSPISVVKLFWLHQIEDAPSVKMYK